MSPIFRLAAVCFAVSGVLIGISAIWAPEEIHLPIFILAGIVSYISVSFYFAFRRGAERINRVSGCLLLVMLWCVLPLPIAIAFLFHGSETFAGAYFEAVSALTTTGATHYDILEGVPQSILVLRSLVQWLGGLLTLLAVTFVLAPIGLGGLPGNQMGITGSRDLLPENLIANVGLPIVLLYVAVTVACFIAITMAQVDVLDALLLTLSTVSSGGFVPSDEGIARLGGPALPVVLTIFMAIAGSSIVWQRALYQGRVDLMKAHRETYLYFLVIVVLGIAYAATFFTRAGSAAVLSPIDALNEGFFTAASLMSTTGFEIREASFTVLPATIVVMLVLIGGCSFSTSGGMSFFRIGGMIHYSLREFPRLVYPNSVDATTFGARRYDFQIIKAIWVYFFAVTLVIMIGTLLLSLRGMSFEASLIASVAGFSNMGGFYATGWQEIAQQPSFGQMDAFSQYVLCALMILGRLHVLALLTAFNMTYWIKIR